MQIIVWFHKSGLFLEDKKKKEGLLKLLFFNPAILYCSICIPVTIQRPEVHIQV